MKRSIVALSLFFGVSFSNHESLGYQRILYIGNSITHHHIAPVIGWYGDWGMAATYPDRDYVHLLTQAIANKQGFTPGILTIDMDIPWIDSNLPDSIPEIINFRPDLIVVQMGNNAPIVSLEEYEKPYRRVMGSLDETSPKKIVLLSEWGRRPASDEVIQRIAVDYGADFVYIADLRTDKDNQAWGNCVDPDVCVHPGDKGMAGIARRIYADLYHPVYFPMLATKDNRLPINMLPTPTMAPTGVPGD